MVADLKTGDPTWPAAKPPANGVPASVPKEDPGAAAGGGCSRDRVRRCLRANLLVLLTVASVVAGVALGLGVSASGGSAALGPARQAAFAFPGELLLRLLRMIILPLVVCSLIAGAASLDPSALGRMGAWALLFFLVTTLMASALGVGIALALQPGVAGTAIGTAAGNASVPSDVSPDTAPSKEVLDSFLDLVRSEPGRGGGKGRGEEGTSATWGGRGVPDGGSGGVATRGGGDLQGLRETVGEGGGSSGLSRGWRDSLGRGLLNVGDWGHKGDPT